jgi:hypothetical protein
MASQYPQSEAKSLDPNPEAPGFASAALQGGSHVLPHD